MNTIKTKLFTNNIVISGDIDRSQRQALVQEGAPRVSEARARILDLACSAVHPWPDDLASLNLTVWTCDINETCFPGCSS